MINRSKLLLSVFFSAIITLTTYTPLFPALFSPALTMSNILYKVYSKESPSYNKNQEFKHRVYLNLLRYGLYTASSAYSIKSFQTILLYSLLNIPIEILEAYIRCKLTSLWTKSTNSTSSNITEFHSQSITSMKQLNATHAGYSLTAIIISEVIYDALRSRVRTFVTNLLRKWVC